MSDKTIKRKRKEKHRVATTGQRTFNSKRRINTLIKMS